MNQGLKAVWLPPPAAGLFRGRDVNEELWRERSSLHITSESASSRASPNPCVTFLTLVNIFPDQGLWQGEGMRLAGSSGKSAVVCAESSIQPSKNVHAGRMEQDIRFSGLPLKYWYSP